MGTFVRVRICLTKDRTGSARQDRARSVWGRNLSGERPLCPRPGYGSFEVTATGRCAIVKPPDTANKMAAPICAYPNEHRAPMKRPSECGWKPGDMEALRDQRQLGRHVDLIDKQALLMENCPLPSGTSPPLCATPAGNARTTEGLAHRVSRKPWPFPKASAHSWAAEDQGPTATTRPSTHSISRI